MNFTFLPLEIKGTPWCGKFSLFYFLNFRNGWSGRGTGVSKFSCGDGNVSTALGAQGVNQIIGPFEGEAKSSKNGSSP